MINLLKCEFYKLSRNFALRVVGIITVLFSVLSAALFIFSGNTAGITAIAASDAMSLIRFDNQVWLILITVLVCSIIVTEHQRGIIRNLVISGKSRVEVYISKLIVCVLLSFAIIAVSQLLYLTLLGINSGWGSHSLGEYIGHLGLVLIQVAAFTALVLFISSLTYSTGATIGISIALLFVFSLFAALSQMFALFGNQSTADIFEFISRLYVGNLFPQVAIYGTASNILLQHSVVGLITFFAFGGGGLYLFNKRDMK